MIAIAKIMKKIPTQKNPGKSDHLYVQLMEYLMNGFSCGMLNKAFFAKFLGTFHYTDFFFSVLDSTVISILLKKLIQMILTWKTKEKMATVTLMMFKP